MAVPVLTPDASLSEIRTAAADSARGLLELRAIPADKRGESWAADVREHADAVVHYDLAEKGKAAAERAALAQAESESRGSKSQRASLQPELRSVGEQVVSNDDYEAWARGNRSQPFVIDVRNQLGGEVRNLIGGFSTGAYESGTQNWLPVVTPQMVAGSQQRRGGYLRDLMTVSPTGLKVIPYVREEAQVTNETGAQMVSEGSAKPEVTMTFETYSAIVEKIAAWLPVTDEIAADAPTLMGYINGRLEYMLMIREEDQIINGTGTSPQLMGLENLSGTQTQAIVTGGGPTGNGGDFSATIGQAFGKIENVDGDPDGVAANPLDFWAAVTKRHAAQFDNGFGTGAPGSSGANITWGERCVRSRAVTSGKAYAGAWKMGATLFDRMQTTIKVADQHSDNFIRNLLVVLAEKRVALAWHRANLFVKVTVPTS